MTVHGWRSEATDHSTQDLLYTDVHSENSRSPETSPNSISMHAHGLQCLLPQKKVSRARWLLMRCQAREVPR